MSSKNNIEESFAELEEQVIALMQICDKLHQENQLLKEQKKKLQAEKAELKEKNQLARARVAAIISRLKALESSQ